MINCWLSAANYDPGSMSKAIFMENKDFYTWFCFFTFHLWRGTGSCLNIKIAFLGIGILIIKIRESWDHFIFIMEIYMLIRQHLYIETGPRILYQRLITYDIFKHIFHILNKICLINTNTKYNTWWLNILSVWRFFFFQNHFVTVDRFL